MAPDIIELFLQENPEFKTLFVGHDDLAQLFIEKIESLNFLKENERNKGVDKYLHEYYKGKWGDVDYIPGFLVDPEVIFSDGKIDFPVSTILKSKPVL